jgi:hypothetical protein
MLLAAGAALLWAVVLALALWLEAHPFAPTALVIASFILALVVLPFTVGAAVAWWWHSRADQDRVSAWAAVVAAWAFLVVAAVFDLVTHFDKQIAYLRDLRNLLEVVLVLGICGAARATTPRPSGAAL